MASHLENSTPKGGSNMVAMPMTVMSAVRGMMRHSPRMSSMSKLPIFCSMVPTARNKRPLEMAWNRMSRMAAAWASGVFRPAQAMMSPRLPMVE